jgi:hypothetical protein
METISTDWIIPLGLALIATAWGSYMTAIIKAKTVLPPLLVNWTLGVLLYAGLVATPWMAMSIETVMMMSICLLGANLGYWKNIMGLRDYMDAWARGRGESKREGRG